MRLINAGNVLHASNPTTAASLIASFELALKAGEKLPLSFYKTLESPSVALYQKGQDAVIASCVQAEHLEIDSCSCRAYSARDSFRSRCTGQRCGRGRHGGLGGGGSSDSSGAPPGVRSRRRQRRGAVPPDERARDAPPQQLISPYSRGSLLKDHLKECFPLETSEGDRTKLVKDSLSKSSKEALVGWTSGDKEAVAAQHKISAAPRGRSWNGPLFCELPGGTASLMQA